MKPDDKRITVEYVTYLAPKGSGTMRGYLALPAPAKGKHAAVVVIHENRGLNPYIEDVARRLANVWVSWNFLPDWTASSGVRHVGQRFADNANTLKMPAYTTTDLALRWKAARNTTLTLRGVNVFDKHYFTTAYYTTNQWFNGTGRRVELTANHRF